MYTLYLLTYCAMFPTARSKWIKRVLPSRYQIRIFVSNAITFVWFSDVGIGKKQLEIEWAFRVRILKNHPRVLYLFFYFVGVWAWPLVRAVQRLMREDGPCLILLFFFPDGRRRQLESRASFKSSLLLFSSSSSYRWSLPKYILTGRHSLG